MQPQCDILPISAFQSTNLSNKVTSFNRLGDRILRGLGYPFVNVEVHRDQLYENISIACEFFTKFAGYTKEYILFDSKLYVRDKGIKLDALVTLRSADSLNDQANNKTQTPTYASEIENTVVYVSNSAIDSSFFTSIQSISAALSGGIAANEIFSSAVYNVITTAQPSLSVAFIKNQQRTITQLGSTSNQNTFNNSFDYDVMDYRKIVDVTDFEQGSTTGINTLFTIEQTLAQQTYFSYSMGNYGFDLVSWYTMKDWLKNREKMLATQPSYDFNDRTQMLRLYPQPGGNSGSYYGVIACYVEKPLRDIIQEQWVHQYALALTKITLGRNRGKFQGTTLFGGGSVNADMLQEGLSEKEKLEEMMYSGAAPGFGDALPVTFLVG